MSRTTGPDDSFFVVGGPVPPDRPVYIFREADQQLYERLRARDFCHVLAPHQMGKTSLLAQAAHRLRSEGIEVATLDLADIGGRNVADDVGRWYYSFAYRIVRELRIRSEMTGWWQSRSGLTIRQRLRDFFLEVVLQSTNRPIVLLLDRIEAVSAQREAWDVFDAIRACFDARATEPEYQRLTFGLLGITGAAHLLRSRHDSLFGISAAVELRDFQPGELRTFSRGLDISAAAGSVVAERVWHWTAGQPYLSQKVYRALARRTPLQVDEASIDRTVARLFFGRNSLRGDSHLAYLAAQATRRTPRRAACLTLYGRVSKGSRIPAERAQPAQRELLDLGLIVDADGELALRNRVYAGAFTMLWVNRNLPFTWQGVAAVLALVLAVVVLPVWYSEYLPRPYVSALKADRQSFVVARDAWERLRMFPGFGAEADRLFADYLVGRSRRADRLPEVQRIGERLAGLPGGEARARLLLAEFWDRRAATMAERGDRDGAILYTLQSLMEPTREREIQLAELLGSSMEGLLATARPDAPLTSLEVDPDSGLITTLDERHEVAVWRIGNGSIQREQRLALSAEEVRPLQRRLVFPAARSGRRLLLTLRLNHARAQDVEVVLRAPSGRQAMLRIADARASGRAGEFRFDSRQHRELLPLLEQSAAGTWSGMFSDVRQGVAGSLLTWSIEIDGVAVHDVPAAGADGTGAIPEPQPALAAMSVLGPGGRRALSWSADAASRGDIVVWDVASGRSIARLPRPAELVSARFVLGHSAVMLIGERELELREAASGRVVGRLPRLAGERSGMPLMSADGRYLVHASEQGPDASSQTLWDLKGMTAIGSIVTGSATPVAAVDARGELLAVSDGEHFVRVWRVRERSLLAECEHPGEPLSVSFDPGGRWLLTTDSTGHLRLWDLTAGCRPVLARAGSGRWQTAFSPDGTGLVAGNLSRGFELLALPGGERVGFAIQPGMGGAGSAPATAAAQPRFLPGSALLLTYDGRKAIKLWSLAWRGAAALSAFSPGAAALAVSPDRGHVAVGTLTGDVRIVPLGPEAELRLGGETGPGFIGHSAAVTRLAFDAGSRLVASGSIGGTIRVWEVAGGAPRNFVANQGDGSVLDLVFLAGGDELVAASRGSVQVLDSATGAVRARVLIRARHPRLAVTPDGRYVLIAGDDDGLTRWDWRRGATTVFAGAGNRVRRVVVSPDGSLIATAGADHTVRLWQLASGTALRRVFMAAAPVDRLWFGADGRRVMAQTGAWLHTLRVDAAGLDVQRSRPLPDADTLVVAAKAARQQLVLVRASTARPTVLRINDTDSWATLPEAAVAPEPIRTRLQLSVNPHGELRPLE